MEILIAIVSLAGSILSIILFFKLWKACDDITTISKNVKPPYDDIFLHILAGYEDEAIKALKLDYVKKLRYKDMVGGDIQAVMNKYLSIFQKLGIELPQHLKDVSAYHQYCNKLSELDSL